MLETVDCPSCGASGGAPFVTSRAQLSTTEASFTFVRCAGCTLVRLSPRPDEASLAGWYRDYILHEGPHAWGRWAPFVEGALARQDRARVRLATEGLALGPDARVLDVGCGQPTFLETLTRTTNARGVGVDVSDAGWRDDPQRFAALELHAGALHDLALRGPFDVVTLWHALEHAPNPVELLQQLRTLAGPHTRLVIEVPDVDSLGRRLQGGRWAGFHTPRHTVAFSPATLRDALTRAGWRVERIRRRGTLDPWVLWWLGRIGNERRPLALERRFLGFLVGRILATPIVALQRLLPLGVMTAVARPG